MKGLTTSSGKTITLEQKPFASGGEGEVYKVTSDTGGQELCCKVYFAKARNKDQQRKIVYMVEHPPQEMQNPNTMICWPTEAVFQDDEFIGFTMPLAFEGSFELYELCTPKTGRKLPQDWDVKYSRSNDSGIKSRLKLCTNLSIALHSVHLFEHYVLVDLKPQNVLVTMDGKVSLIDCDSIQITNGEEILFPAQVATPEYVPPEGASVNPKKEMVLQSWDRFSLAIMFYELLFGLHPYAASFSGEYQNSTSLDSKIKNGLFVHGEKSSFLDVLPPLHENFHILPQELQNLFYGAFDRSNLDPETRPTAEDWGKTIYRILTQENHTFMPKV